MSTSPLTVEAPVAGLRTRVGALADEFRLDAGIVAMFVASRLLLVGAAVVAET